MIWTKCNCNLCHENNWVYLGDPEDCTLPDVEGFVCWSCKHKNIIDEQCLEWTTLEDAYYRDGLKTPH